MSIKGSGGSVFEQADVKREELKGRARSGSFGKASDTLDKITADTSKDKEKP